MAFHRDNHYVPRLYLKNFANSLGLIATYRILLSHPRQHDWIFRSTKSLSWHSHLYTRIVSGVESDDTELWFKREFEDPAEISLRKVIADDRLQPVDWRNLTRFLAAQDVRTPARLMEIIKRAQRDAPKLLNDTLTRTVEAAEAARLRGESLRVNKTPNSDLFPVRVISEIDKETGMGRLKAEMSVGRSYWLFAIQHALTSSVRVLLEQRWTILKPPAGITWFTSDDPVVKLNFKDSNHYDLKGGWGSKRTEIFLPLSPRHLLYTRVGERPPDRGTVVAADQAVWFRRFMAQHAHRYIFAVSPQADVPAIRPRVEDAALVRHEQDEWLNWNETQKEAEREILKPLPLGPHSS